MLGGVDQSAMYGAPAGAIENPLFLPPLDSEFVWNQLVDAMNGVQGAYTALARDVQATVDRNAVLTQAALRELSAPERDTLVARRRSVDKSSFFALVAP